eukprot:6201133-Pleurochrysis_carterae.AAC.6
MAAFHSRLSHAANGGSRMKGVHGGGGNSALDARNGFFGTSGHGGLQIDTSMDSDPVSINSVVLHAAMGEKHGNVAAQKTGHRPETPTRFSRFVAAPHLAAKLRGRKMSLPPLRKAAGDGTIMGSSECGSGLYASPSAVGIGEGAPSEASACLASREDARSGTRSPLSRLLRVGRHDH